MIMMMMTIISTPQIPEGNVTKKHECFFNYRMVFNNFPFWEKTINVFKIKFPFWELKP